MGNLQIKSSIRKRKKDYDILREPFNLAYEDVKEQLDRRHRRHNIQHCDEIVSTDAAIHLDQGVTQELNPHFYIIEKR